VAGRIRIIIFFFLVAWIVLVYRLFYWQVGSFNKLFSSAKLQHQAQKEIDSLRGKIFTSDNFPLVLNKESYLVFVDPTKIKDSLKDYEKISKVISFGKDEFLKIVENKKIQWYPIAKEVDLKVKEQLQNENIEGIGFEPHWEREYPEASAAAHLLGFVGSDELGEEKGYFGLEGFYNRELKGTPGERSWEKDLYGRSIVIGSDLEKKPKQGRDLFLFLNRSLQFLVEKELKNGIEKYGAISGSVVVLDPQSGGVLAMASIPSFDIINFSKEDQEKFSNPIISGSFEPGSIFKPLVMATAIDLNLVNQSTICEECSGQVQIGEYTIKTWNEKYYPNSTMREIIQHSDNVGMVFVAKKIGVDNLFHYLTLFGIGQKTNVDLEGEWSPVLRPKDSWTQIDLATSGFGQGVAVTPIQMIRAFAAIANGGKLMTPKVVEKMKEGEKEIFMKEGSPKQIIKPVTAKVMTEMLVNAVENGEAKWAKPKGYKIAGKTGTAQIPFAGHYDKEKTVASFIGFAPAENPKFAMLVTLKEPKTSPWGSETAAPLWFQIAKGIFSLWGIPPG